MRWLAGVVLVLSSRLVCADEISDLFPAKAGKLALFGADPGPKFLELERRNFRATYRWMDEIAIDERFDTTRSDAAFSCPDLSELKVATSSCERGATKVKIAGELGCVTPDEKKTHANPKPYGLAVAWRGCLLQFEWGAISQGKTKADALAAMADIADWVRAVMGESSKPSDAELAQNRAKVAEAIARLHRLVQRR
jgi:hypothetical protein